MSAGFPILPNCYYVSITSKLYLSSPINVIAFFLNTSQMTSEKSKKWSKQSLPLSTLFCRKDCIWKSDLVPVQRVLAWPGVVDGSISKQDIIIHAVDKEGCECDNKQKLTVGRKKEGSKSANKENHNMQHSGHLCSTTGTVFA